MPDLRNTPVPDELAQVRADWMTRMSDIVGALDWFLRYHTENDADPVEVLNGSFDLLIRAREEIVRLREALKDTAA